MSIHYLKGDATNPLGEGNIMIVHICNDIGRWDAGFVLAVSRRWQEPRRIYLEHIRSGACLSDVSFVSVTPNIWVANMIAQHGVQGNGGSVPIRYGALRACLIKVSLKAEELSASIHMPRIGCGRAGGDWSAVEKIILETLSSHEVFVYDLI